MKTWMWVVLGVGGYLLAKRQGLLSGFGADVVGEPIVSPRPGVPPTMYPPVPPSSVRPILINTKWVPRCRRLAERIASLQAELVKCQGGPHYPAIPPTPVIPSEPVPEPY